FTFVGRGFDLKTAVPLDKTLRDGLVDVAEKVVDACPTGALACNEKYRPVGSNGDGKLKGNAENADDSAED
ncbi:MAG: hypothetical protein ACC661_04390, partial [Verrucomicrobiales bacterium]